MQNDAANAEELHLVGEGELDNLFGALGHTDTALGALGVIDTCNEIDNLNGTLWAIALA